MQPVRQLAFGLLLAALSVQISAAQQQSVDASLKEMSEMKRDRASLISNLNSDVVNTKVRSATSLWKKFESDRPLAIDVMEHDPNPDVRRRIAQVLASQHRVPEAISVLERSLAEYDIKTEQGGAAFIHAATILQEVTGRSFGTSEALKVLTAPSGWFTDADALPYPELRKDGLRTSAAALLAAQKEMAGNKEFRAGLKAYCRDVEAKAAASSGKERKGWQGRLRTILDIASRAQLEDLVLEYSDYLAKVEDKYEKANFEKVLDRAKRAKKK